ncbi:DHA2 family efflux MFS transporter permease subunit [Conservatibacter flavescens]|uniref:MFS transporter n=1 Tax=Conservatibacter flavescens TaxID=28161 RepID=A0A2M8S4Y2_9PAST|nr:DHA2 family efflux MFS transporter permease subunit [Conservatibacter flavescens]PJG86158.1 MFS transporter [Conservatibacter flavescens]
MEQQINNHALSWVAAIAFFMQALDATILNTALPTIATYLHESPLQMQLAVISYALTVALLIPISGWVADRYGTLHVFRFATLVFVLGSIACAASTSLNLLVISRIIQGIGGAMMMPVARLVIIKTIPKNQLLSSLNLMAMAGLLGPVLGPILGGWIVTYTTWHWIFLINIPIGLVSLWASSRFMPNIKEVHISTLDWFGFILFGGGLVALTLGLDLIGENVAKKWTALSIFGGGCALLFAYYLYAKRKSNPLMTLALYETRTFSLGSLANLLVRFCASGVPFLLPLMLQVVFKYSPDMAGWMLTPIALSSILVKPWLSKLLSTLGYKRTLLCASVLMCLSVAAMGLLRETTPLWWHIVVLACYGASMSTIFSAVNSLTVCDLPPHHNSAGSTMLSVVQQVGIGFGIALSAVILGIYRLYLPADPQALQQAFSYTFFTTASFGILLLWCLSYLRSNDGEVLQTKKKSL